jgi:hypothetical protein
MFPVIMSNKCVRASVCVPISNEHKTNFYET